MNPKKQNIINAAYTLFINKGYNASSIQDILDEAGVSKGTFYNYFTSKTQCLIAIMESIGSELSQLRMAAAAGRPVNDPKVLADQLSIRIKLNREKNIFSLYESIFYSQDQELKEFSKLTYLKELDWIASRIVDVFGNEAKPYALDNAAALHGSIQQLFHLWKVTSHEALPTDELASFVVRRLEVTMAHQIATGDRFMRISGLYPKKHAENLSPTELGAQLESYSKSVADGDTTAQLVAFLGSELQADKPRKALIESVLGTVANKTGHDAELLALLEQVWKQLAKL
ncbi:TetR/AcrR family transcriptional regulator [Planococcus sp. APC 3906]|uniref:TetR/AcrR family transcriptional regulator n=1 Tax=Planococcus sp. APC 3906 TaxID=3035194 RepID=UPI0025B46099|nr:TetR/AcrR family transcriptional regulator [Planococcus sp. APC 3906]MDN3450842.1 TetR/AcrR family transcriptional regulator [Planococcus sp. APC 3906]